MHPTTSELKKQMGNHSNAPTNTSNPPTTTAQGYT
jgi:hypothetical protein